MSWRFSADVETYAARTWRLLTSRPVENTIALTVVDHLRRGLGWSDQPPLFGWYGDREVSGAVSMTPPYDLLLSVVPDHAMGPLVSALVEAQASLPGVTGEASVVERFAAAWANATGTRSETSRRERLYALDAVHPPPTPPGRARLATALDHDLAVGWVADFQAEVGVPATDLEAQVRRATDDRLLWLWEDDTGRPASLAVRRAPVAAVSRVGPVYTPPGRRGRGFGTAVTAAATADALARGAERVVLFTDLANPTSNSIYQRIGYRPVRDHRTIRFTA